MAEGELVCLELTVFIHVTAPHKENVLGFFLSTSVIEHDVVEISMPPHSPVGSSDP